MANDLNQCSFIGRLGADPEMRYMPDGKAVAKFRIACGWKSAEKEGTEWVPVSFFGKVAEVCGQYLKKGSQVYVQGQFTTRKFTDKDGIERYTTEIRGDRMQMLGGKSEEKPQAKPAGKQKESAGFSDFEDDIPF